MITIQVWDVFCFREKLIRRDVFAGSQTGRRDSQTSLLLHQMRKLQLCPFLCYTQITAPEKSRAQDTGYTVCRI